VGHLHRVSPQSHWSSAAFGSQHWRLSASGFGLRLPVNIWFLIAFPAGIWFSDHHPHQDSDFSDRVISIRKWNQQQCQHHPCHGPIVGIWPGEARRGRKWGGRIPPRKWWHKWVGWGTSLGTTPPQPYGWEEGIEIGNDPNWDSPPGKK
jgi:hypothetical protein